MANRYGISAEDFLRDIPDVPAKLAVKNKYGVSAEDFLKDVPDNAQQQPVTSDMDMFKQVAQTGIQNNPIMSAVKDYFTKALPAFGNGMVRGATFDTVGQKPTLEGSIMQPKLEKYANTAGQVVGSAIPIIASEMEAGVAMPALVAKYGFGPVQEAIAKSALTGGIFAANKGAAQNAPITQTGSNMLTDAASFSAIGALGQGMGYLRKVFGRVMPEDQANYFLNTPNKVSESRLNKGQPSLGEDFLNSPSFENVATRKQAFDKSKFEIDRLENQIQFKLQELTDQARTPVPNTAQVQGTPLLTYNPTQVTTPSPSIRQLPPGGEIINLPEVQTQQPGGAKYQTMINPGNIVDFTGRTGLPSTSADVSQDAIVKNIRDYNNLKNSGNPFTGIKKGPSINTQEIANSLDDVINKEKSLGTTPGNVRKLENMKNNFINSKDDNLTISQANELRRYLDTKVGDSYLNPSSENPLITQANQKLANTLRSKIAEVSPELADLFQKQHLMIEVKNALAPVVTAKNRITGMTMFGYLADKARTNITTAQALRSALGDPSQFIAPATGLAAKSIADTIGQGQTQ